MLIVSNRSGLSRDRLDGERQRRAGLDAPLRPDVEPQARRRRTDRLAVGVPIGVDDDDRMLAAQGQEPAAKLDDLLAAHGELRRRVRPHRPVDVVPEVHRPVPDEGLDVGVAEHLVGVLAGHRGRDAEEELGLLESAEAAQGRVKNPLAAALVVVGLQAVDAHQRRDVSGLADPRDVLVGQEHPVGDELEVAVGVPQRDFPPAGIEHRLAAQQAVEIALAPLARGDDPVDLLLAEGFRPALGGDPAAVAAEVAGAGDRQEQKRREKLPPLQPLADTP